jgi:hypothetical protein
MRYRFPDQTKIERATPAGLETLEFEAGEIEIDDDSDERLTLEIVAVSTGVAERVTTKSSKTPKE